MSENPDNPVLVPMPLEVRWKCPEDTYRIYQPPIPQTAMDDPPIRAHFEQIRARELVEMIDAHRAEYHQP